MSDAVLQANTSVDVAEPEEIKPPIVTADERIAHRGPIQRLLVSPEIGAIIGAVLVWAFFWGNGRTFGTAATTLIVLDAAAPIGIMAVVVALLMIGGEFDLSAGMMTGATGILVGLMVKYFVDTGAPMWLAVASAFIIAGTIGVFNGTTVNRTGLPSFIVTLATFFVLKGVTLVLAKRLEGKVSVADVDQARGYGPFYRFFGYEYKFENFGWRDQLFVGSVLIGGVLLIMGLCEQSFIRRTKGDSVNTRSVSGRTAAGFVGVVLAAAGFTMLHRSDGVNNNAIWGACASIGIIVAVVGLCESRYKQRSDQTGDGVDNSLPAPIRNLVLLGTGSMFLAYLTPFVFDRNERREILTWFPHGLRVAVAVLAGLTGVAIGIRHALPRLRGKFPWYRPIFSLLLSIGIGLILMVGVLTFFQLATVQALRTVAMLAFASLGLAMLMRARAQAGKISSRLQLMVGLISVLVLVALAFLVRADSGAVRFRSGLFGAMLIAAVVLTTNTLLETRLQKRRSIDPAADRRGRRFVAFGVLLPAIGMGIRIVFTNASGGAGEGGFSVTRMSILWWIVATVIGAFVLTKTKWGNWIFAVGGNKEAARAIGVPANKVKVGLFVATSLAGCFVGIMVLLRFTSVQASQGDGLEFIYIIAAVVGGNLMTGGYGSVIGASVGALIIAMSYNGIGAARWNSDGKFAFQGVVLLIAVLVNNYTRKKAQEAR